VHVVIKGGRCAAYHALMGRCAAYHAGAGLRPGGDPSGFSVIICDGNHTINNY
jgi:hypothetical protein